MAIGFIISGLGTTPTTTQSGAGDVNIQELLATPAPGQPAGDAGDSGSSEQNGDAAVGQESTTE